MQPIGKIAGFCGHHFGFRLKGGQGCFGCGDRLGLTEWGLGTLDGLYYFHRTGLEAKISSIPVCSEVLLFIQAAKPDACGIGEWFERLRLGRQDNGFRFHGKYRFLHPQRFDGRLLQRFRFRLDHGYGFSPIELEVPSSPGMIGSAYEGV